MHATAQTKAMDKQTCGNSEHDSVPQHQELNKNQHISVCRRNFSTHTGSRNLPLLTHEPPIESQNGTGRNLRGMAVPPAGPKGHGGSAGRTMRGMAVPPAGPRGAWWFMPLICDFPISRFASNSQTELSAFGFVGLLSRWNGCCFTTMSTHAAASCCTDSTNFDVFEISLRAILSKF